MKLKDATKKKAIIEKTIDIVYEKGFAGIKMANLARLVGVSPSTLYVYYKNKEDLIVSIATELFTSISKESHNEIQEDLPFKIKLKTLWLYWLNFSINKSKEMSFLQQLKQSPFYQLVPAETKDAKMQLANSLLDLGKKEGLIKNIDNQILSSITGSLLAETSKMMINKQLALNEQNNDLMFSILWDAIKS